MKQRIFARLLSATWSAGFVLATGCTVSISQAHGSHDAIVAPAPLSDESIIHRIEQMGYSNVKIKASREDTVDVELDRAGVRGVVTVNRAIVGPASLTSFNAAEVIRNSLRPATAAPN